MARANPPYSASYRSDAVALVRSSRKSIPQVVRDLGINDQSLRKLVKRAEVDAGQDPPGELTTSEREELRRLRRENATLQMERDILNKATAFFAKKAR